MLLSFANPELPRNIARFVSLAFPLLFPGFIELRAAQQRMLNCLSGLCTRTFFGFLGSYRIYVVLETCFPRSGLNESWCFRAIYTGSSLWYDVWALLGKILGDPVDRVEGFGLPTSQKTGRLRWLQDYASESDRAGWVAISRPPSCKWFGWEEINKHWGDGECKAHQNLAFDNKNSHQRVSLNSKSHFFMRRNSLKRPTRILSQVERVIIEHQKEVLEGR